jgi:hypothetical protein
VIGLADDPECRGQIVRADADDVDARDGRDLVNRRQPSRVVDRDLDEDLAVRLRGIRRARHGPVPRGAAVPDQAAAALGGKAHGVDQAGRLVGGLDAVKLDALRADVEQPRDQRPIEVRDPHDWRDVDCFGGDDHVLHGRQVNGIVLEVDEGGVQAGEADELDDGG